MWNKKGKPPTPDTLKKKTRRLLRKAQNIEVALKREQDHQSIMMAHKHDYRTFFRLIQKQRQTRKEVPIELEVNGRTYSDTLLEPWTEHFSSLASPSHDQYFNEDFTTQVDADVKAIQLMCDRINWQHIPITANEVGQAIRQLKNKKAKDEEGIVAENLKLGGPNISIFITKLINMIIEMKTVQTIIKCGVLHPIHTKNKLIKVSGNYTGITITNTIAKVFNILQARH